MSRGGQLLGYTVAVNRPTGRDPGRWEVVGSVHTEREPADNHRAWCEATAEADPALYGHDVRYAVVEVRMARDPVSTELTTAALDRMPTEGETLIILAARDAGFGRPVEQDGQR